MTKAHPVEGDVKKEIKKLLDKHRWFHWMPAANVYGSNGQSDHMAIKAGIFLCIEAKLKESKGSDLQEGFLQRVRDAGGYGIVVNQKSLPKFAAMLERLDKVIDARELARMTKRKRYFHHPESCCLMVTDGADMKGDGDSALVEEIDKETFDQLKAEYRQ